MKLRISLHTRFMVWFTFLLVFLVGAILLVIEKREVATIFEESKNKGVLMAKNIGELNLRNLANYYVDDLLASIREQVNEKLLYVVFFDQSGAPIAYNPEIADRKELWCCSRLQGVSQVDVVDALTKDVFLAKKLQRVLEIEIPIFSRGPMVKRGSIKIGLSLEDMRAEIRKTRLALVLIGAAGFLLGMIGATLLARRITQPIKKLMDGTVRVSKGDFSHPIKIESADELGNLAMSFNEMSARLMASREQIEEAHKKLIQAEKLASIGKLSATIAHEIRNPLTSVKLNIQKVLEDGRLGALEQEHLAITQEGIGQIEKFIKELLNFTRVSGLQLDHFSIAQIIEESMKMIGDCFQPKRIAIERRIEEGVPEVLVDGDKMRQVFLNVLRNACEAVPDGGKVSLTVSVVAEARPKKVRIWISDNGCGIPDKDWEAIFEPFFSTKASGFGLGLANARKIVEQHKGTIRVIKKRSPGTVFEILIPGEGEP
ncbi:MAG: ATP-binding protein [Candidatus Aminicenantes bacterium]|nr:ATP-binding protein [Candidatus Aminicenantes bacterium]